MPIQTSNSIRRRLAALEARAAAQGRPEAGDQAPEALDVGAMFDGWLADGYLVQEGGEYAPGPAAGPTGGARFYHARGMAALFNALADGLLTVGGGHDLAAG